MERKMRTITACLLKHTTIAIRLVHFSGDALRFLVMP